MSSPYGRLLLIANPHAGRGAMGAALPAVQQVLRHHGLAHRVALTRGPGHATELAYEALSSGVRYLVAAGGDGTVHEVLNGMLTAGNANQDTVLGVVPYGSGCDFVRTFDLPSRAVPAAHRLAGALTRRIDVGTVAFVAAGAPHRRHFANIAEVGFGAAVVGTAARLPARLGPARYPAAVGLRLPRYRVGAVRIDVDGDVLEVPAVNVVVANGRYFGGGMQIAPLAAADDGVLDVLAMVGRKTAAVTVVPRLYRGTHLPDPRIVERRARVIRVGADRPLLVEADGELLGTTPATFGVLPGALRLKV